MALQPAAVIVGSDPLPEVERPLFELEWTAQTILPDSQGAIDGHLREVGLTFHLLKDVPGLISKNRPWLKPSNLWVYLIITQSFGLLTRVDQRFLTKLRTS